MPNGRGPWIAGGLALVLLAIGLYVHRYIPVAILSAALVFGGLRAMLMRR